MSRKWVLFLSAVIMLVLALVVARVFREPLPVEEVAAVGDTVSGQLQTAPVVPPSTPLPPAEAMIMSSGDSLPVTNVAPDDTRETTGVAPLVRDATSGALVVTEAPRVPAVPPAEPSSPASDTPAVSSAPSGPAPSSPSAPTETPPPADDKPVPTEPGTAPRPVEPAVPSPSAPTPSTPSTVVTEPAPSSPAPSPSTPTPVKADTADKPLKPGTLVTKSSLPAKAGVRVVESAILTMDGDVVTLNLRGGAPMRGKSFMLTGPDRVVLDIDGDWKVEAPRVPSNRMVRSLRVGTQDKATRLVFDMRVTPLKVKVTNPTPDSLELTIR